MSIDIHFIHTVQLKTLKEDKNLTINESSGLMYNDPEEGESSLGLYGGEDEDYVTVARYIGKNFFPLLAYLWKTYGIMGFDDYMFDEQELFHIAYGLLKDRGITEDDLHPYIDYFCANAMLHYFDDESLHTVMEKNKEGYDKVMKAFKEWEIDREKELAKEREEREKNPRPANNTDLPDDGLPF